LTGRPTHSIEALPNWKISNRLQQLGGCGNCSSQWTVEPNPRDLELGPGAVVTSTAECDLLHAFSQNEAWLRTALQARLGGADEVEEVMQEVALAAASQAAKSEPVQRVGPWLYRVALRQVMLFRRKAGRRRKLMDGFQRLANRTAQRTPLEFLLSQERQKLVREAMSPMAELDRQLLMLKYVDGLSYGEIAERLGVTARAVQSRLHRARTALRNNLSVEVTGENDESS
jgi:RNA polymerase sigma factor (sigma-70 family)